jgi:type IV pilus assembly protein PilB
MSLVSKKLRLGDILVQQGYINEKQLEGALQAQRKTRQRLGDYLVDSGLITDTEIAQALHIQLGLELIQLRGISISQEVISLVNGSVLRKHNVLPVGFDPDTNDLILAMSDPLDMSAIDDIAIITNSSIEPRISTTREINAVLDKYFGSDEAMSAAEQYSKEKEQYAAVLEANQAEQDAELSSAPIVALVRSIIEQAVRIRASDIHLDAMEKQLRVRFRIDGVLVEKMLYDISLLPAIITRIKIMGSMDISEKRKPQDGRISVLVDRDEYDIRVSVLPTYYGEKVVMRLASKSAMTKSKLDLGMRKDEMALFDRILSHRNGILLITGPTGSGKSTTVYTALSELNSEQVNIITVEDPVEASIPGINQVQVNNKTNLSFANALRSILRQDPDIIMIGEMRDHETASIAVQASITGHLVLSTLHTKSAAASITRLLDMGIEGYLLADSILGVIAQRLVRRLCPNCKKPRLATEEEMELLGLAGQEPIEIYDSGSCQMCGETGYYGRIGVYEIIELSGEIKRIISKKGNTEDIKQQAIKEGMKTIHMSAALHVIDGVTSIAEMMKISFDEE